MKKLYFQISEEKEEALHSHLNTIDLSSLISAMLTDLADGNEDLMIYLSRMDKDRLETSVKRYVKGQKARYLIKAITTPGNINSDVSIRNEYEDYKKFCQEWCVTPVTFTKFVLELERISKNEQL